MGQKRCVQKKSAFSASNQVTNAQCKQVCQQIIVGWWQNWTQDQDSMSFFVCSEQKAYLEKVKQERLVKEELMSQDDEEDIPVTEREMNLKVNMKMVMPMPMTMMVKTTTKTQKGK